MNPTVYDDLEHTLTSAGPDAAVEHLCATLREEKDYHNLFYALLLRKRHELGVSPIPTGPSADLPDAAVTPYEEGIRAAAREIGGLFLEAGNLPQAYGYYRMIGETAPVRAALDSLEPGPDEDVQPLVQIAFYEGVHPRKGFEWALRRFGICNAITTLSSHELPHSVEDKQHCIRRLVQALYEELRERLVGEIERHDGSRPDIAGAPPDTPGVVLKLMEDRDWLFADDFYHIDMSHLSSVVQMSIHLPKCPDLALARELCAYGRRLSPKFVGAGDPPFEDQYRAYDLYLTVLQGDNIEEALGYFRRRAEEANPEEVGTYPAEVLVNLMLKLDRPREALAVARKHLVGVDNRRLTCPGVPELCQKTGDYRTLAEAAREQGDVVHFLAGMLAARK
jgi:hypothetical protein